MPDEPVRTRQDLPSRTLYEGFDRAGARAFLYGIGYTREALERPIVGVAHSWTSTMPCNFNHRRLAVKVKPDGMHYRRLANVLASRPAPDLAAAATNYEAALRVDAENGSAWFELARIRSTTRSTSGAKSRSAAATRRCSSHIASMAG